MKYILQRKLDFIKSKVPQQFILLGFKVHGLIKKTHMSCIFVVSHAVKMLLISIHGSFVGD